MFLNYAYVLYTAVLILKADYHLCFGVFQKKFNKINAKGTSQQVGSVAGQASANYR
ncbi:hypothetical protein MCO_01803 [Bartonella sp. DB5-6]|nr:hypothetical protein MCO_01803 [Bartonella sp. DB5-6]